MDTADRQQLRELAYTMEATYRDDAEGLVKAQGSAREAVEMLRKFYPNETDDTLAVVAYALTTFAGRVSYLHPRSLATALEVAVGSYPFTAAALAGVYVLPELKERDGEPAKPKPAAGDDGTGQYL